MTDEWIRFEGGRIHYRYRDGRGPDLVVLPGGVLDSSRLTWKKVVAELPEGYRVFVIDLPGYGGSDPPARHFWSTRGHASDVHGVLVRLEIENPVLFAASLGAAVALDLLPIGRSTTTKWDRYRGLVLSGAYGLQGRLPAHELAFILTRFRQVAHPLRRVLRMRFVTKRVLHLVIHDPDAIDDELVDDVLHEARREHALETFFDWLHGEVQPNCVMSNFREDLSRMHVPALILHGRHDWIVSPEKAREATRRFPDAELHILEAGHMVARERPDEVNRLVHAFLKKHAPLR